MKRKKQNIRKFLIILRTLKSIKGILPIGTMHCNEDNSPLDKERNLSTRNQEVKEKELNTGESVHDA